VSGRPTVTVYMHPDCHLCAVAIDRLRELAPRLGFALALVDVYADPQLLARYFERVPVVAVEGVEVCSLYLDERALSARLAAAATGA